VRRMVVVVGLAAAPAAHAGVGRDDDAEAAL
jgi:hypothetical protein